MLEIAGELGVPFTLSLKLTTIALSVSSSLKRKLEAASCRKRMWGTMLPEVSRTRATERGMRSPSPSEASLKYVTSCLTPSSSSWMSLIPRPGTKRPALSKMTAVTETTLTSASITRGGAVVGGCTGGAGGVEGGVWPRAAIPSRTRPTPPRPRARGRVTRGGGRAERGQSVAAGRAGSPGGRGRPLRGAPARPA